MGGTILPPGRRAPTPSPLCTPSAGLWIGNSHPAPSSDSTCLVVPALHIEHSRTKLGLLLRTLLRRSSPNSKMRKVFRKPFKSRTVFIPGWGLKLSPPPLTISTHLSFNTRVPTSPSRPRPWSRPPTSRTAGSAPPGPPSLRHSAQKSEPRTGRSVSAGIYWGSPRETLSISDK